MAANASTTIDAPSHWASQWLRIGWFLALNRAVEWRAASLGPLPPYKPKRPVPRFNELLSTLGRLIEDDSAAVRQGLYPAMPDDGTSLADYVGRIRAMMADLPEALRRRATDAADTAKAAAAGEDLPAYFVQDFHFQSGGYLTHESARLYDLQVETLFFGAAGPMRRSVLRTIAQEMRGCDQRKRSLLDVGCGAGAFLKAARCRRSVPPSSRPTPMASALSRLRAHCRVRDARRFSSRRSMRRAPHGRPRRRPRSTCSTASSPTRARFSPSLIAALSSAISASSPNGTPIAYIAVIGGAPQAISIPA